MQEDIKVVIKGAHEGDVCSCGFNLGYTAEAGSRVKISRNEVNVLPRRYNVLDGRTPGETKWSRGGLHTLHLIWHRYRWRSAVEPPYIVIQPRRHSVGHCNFTDTLARAIGTGVCTGLCKQAHPAGVITPLRVIDNVRARGRERERERAKESKTEKRRKERRESERGGGWGEGVIHAHRVVSLTSIRCPAKGLAVHAARRDTFRESAFLRYAIRRRDSDCIAEAVNRDPQRRPRDPVWVALSQSRSPMKDTRPR